MGFYCHGRERGDSRFLGSKNHGNFSLKFQSLARPQEPLVWHLSIIGPIRQSWQRKTKKYSNRQIVFFARKSWKVQIFLKHAKLRSLFLASRAINHFFPLSLLHFSVRARHICNFPSSGAKFYCPSPINPAAHSVAKKPTHFFLSVYLSCHIISLRGRRETRRPKWFKTYSRWHIIL